MANLKKQLLVWTVWVLAVVLITSIVSAQVEFGEGVAVSEPKEPPVVADPPSWFGWLWDWLTSPFVDKPVIPEEPPMTLVLSDHNDSVDNSYYTDEPVLYWDDKCEWVDKNSTWLGCNKQNGTTKVFHQSYTPVTKTWQEISDGETKLTVSPDFWCWQESTNVVMCESMLDCQYGPAHIPQTDNAGCTYQMYRLDEGVFTKANYGNNKVLAKAESTSKVEAVTVEEATP